MVEQLKRFSVRIERNVRVCVILNKGNVFRQFKMTLQ